MDSTINNFLAREELSHIYLPSEIIFNLLVSFILGLVVSVVYKKTHKGLSYSQSFVVTNIFIAVHITTPSSIFILISF